MTSKDVIHEIFLPCRRYTQDSFWQEMLFSLACNKFPKGMKYDARKSVIYVRYEITKGRPKNETFPMPQIVSLGGGITTSGTNKDNTRDVNKELFTLLMHIFKDILNLRSDKDITNSKQELENIRKCSEIDLEVDWKKLKPRSMKNQILMNFAMSQITEYELDPKNVKHLYNTIQLGFQFKSLSSDDVIYEKGSVTSITGLEFDPQTNTFIITNPQKSLPKTDKPIPKTNRLFQTVDKWARDHKTYYNIHN